MEKIVYTKEERIIIEDKPIASGGEGSVHKIISPDMYKNKCIKIYKDSYKNKEKELKIDYMVKNPPDKLSDTRYLICWPEKMVFDQKGFIGFMMNLAIEGSIELEKLCVTKLNKKLDKKWLKFDRKNTDENEQLILRLKVCVNIAIAIFTIHSKKHYVLVDAKPPNMLISENGKISLIDLDSIQISEESSLLYNSVVSSVEYSPPESRYKTKKEYIDYSWDIFSMAVIFYRVLFGIHPYAVLGKGLYQNITEVQDCIKEGLFAFGSKKHLLDFAEPHNNYEKLSNNLKELFFLTFDKSQNNPQLRPDSNKWGETLYKEVISFDRNKKSTIEKEETKKCPFCAEIIRKDAIKCRFCGEFLNTEEKGKKIFAEPKPKIIIPDDFVLVEGGTFIMGDGKNNDNPKHQVTISSFYIGKYQVTQKEYQEIMGENPSYFKGDNSVNLPVENLTWYDSIKFCNAKSKKEGLPIAYNDSIGTFLDPYGRETKDLKKVKGYRLPTETEWEFAAKGGKKSCGHLYSGSNDPNEVAWFYENSEEKLSKGFIFKIKTVEKKTHSVGLKKNNELGLYDMSGNVWEFCDNGIVKGGSWALPKKFLTCSFRGENTPYHKNNDIGFRVILVI